MSIERDFDQPNGLFYWFDVLGVTDLRKVIPNLGADDFDGIDAMGVIRGNIDAAQEVSLNLIKKLVPGTLRVKVTMADAALADETFTILMGEEVEPRRKFIEENAVFVQNLDA